MTSFKDQMLNDLNNVFFNTDEFAQTVNWDGTDIDVIPAVTDGQDTSSSNADEHGALVQRRAYMVKTADFSVEPVPMQQVMIDGEAWYVDRVDPFPGSYTIKLLRYWS
jgi:hypothetical protein